MDPQQGADFVALLAAVRVQLPEEQFFVTAALPASRSVLHNIDIAQAASYLDYVNLMAYDFCGSWSQRSGHQAQLYSMSKDETSGSSGVSYLVGHGCPTRKILLGIPLYGRSFLGLADQDIETRAQEAKTAYSNTARCQENMPKNLWING